MQQWKQQSTTDTMKESDILIGFLFLSSSSMFCCVLCFPSFFHSYPFLVDKKLIRLPLSPKGT